MLKGHDPPSFREEVLHDLRLRRPYTNAQFRDRDIDELVRCLDQYERRPWTAKKVLEARREIFADFDPSWLQFHFGKGKKPRRAWAIMAYRIAPLTLAALRGADQLAGRKPRRGYGSVTGSFVTFVHQRLNRIATQTDTEPPKPETILSKLKAYQVHHRRRRRKPKVKQQHKMARCKK